MQMHFYRLRSSPFVAIDTLFFSGRHLHLSGFPIATFDYRICFLLMIIEGSLEVKLPTIWTDEKQSRAEAERRERLEERREEEKESEERRCRCAKR